MNPPPNPSLENRSGVGLVEVWMIEKCVPSRVTPTPATYVPAPPVSAPLCMPDTAIPPASFVLTQIHPVSPLNPTGAGVLQVLPPFVEEVRNPRVWPPV